jgi:8-oxo-dGTP pyrophosphatase MutT (NUDIX family)
MPSGARNYFESLLEGRSPMSDQKTGTIRPIAICILRRGGGIFVFEGRDRVKGETFYRPLGGAVEFGERGSRTVERELREEAGAEISDVAYLGMLENIFTYEGRPKHEIVLVYRAQLRDPERFNLEVIQCREDDGQPFRAMWKPLKEFAEGRAILYPEGLLELIMNV